MRWVHGLWLAGLFLTLLATPAAGGEKQWVEVRSRNFSLITDAGEKEASDVLLRFEQMRAAFGALFHDARLNSPVPLQIVAFANRNEMLNYAPLWNGKPKDNPGLFHASDDRNFILLDLSEPDAWRVVFHEYGHHLLNVNLSRMPAWYDEGYAEYCAAINIRGDVIDFGGVSEPRVATLRDKNWMKTIDLFIVEHESEDYNDPERRGIFYAQSWLTVHYIMENNFQPQLNAYLKAVRENVPVRLAIRRGFGIDPEELDNALRDYFRAGIKKYLQVRMPENIDPGPYATRPLPELEKRAILADVHCHSSDHRDEGIEEFREILKSDPDNYLANRSLGYAMMEKQDYAGARDYIRRAAAKDNADARVHYLQALLLMRANGGRGSFEGVDEMRAEAQKAIALDPNLADAYGLLAYTDDVLRDYAASLRNMRKAVELNPRAEHLQMSLGVAQMHNQDWDGAKATLMPLTSSSDPSTAAAAKSNLQQLETMRRMATQAHIGATPGRKILTIPRTAQPAPELPSGPRTLITVVGRLTSIDCSAAPAAVLKITAQGKQIELRASDRNKVLVLGAQDFSCAWKDKTVAVNYRTSDHGPEVFSVEIR